jgi:hypothetical protein
MALSGGPSLGVEDSYKDNMVASPCIHQAYALSIDAACIVHNREMAGSVAIDYNKKDCDTTDSET